MQDACISACKWCVHVASMPHACFMHVAYIPREEEWEVGAVAITQRLHDGATNAPRAKQLPCCQIESALVVLGGVGPAVHIRSRQLQPAARRCLPQLAESWPRLQGWNRPCNNVLSVLCVHLWMARWGSPEDWTPALVLLPHPYRPIRLGRSYRTERLRERCGAHHEALP